MNFNNAVALGAIENALGALSERIEQLNSALVTNDKSEAIEQLKNARYWHKTIGEWLNSIELGE